MSKNFLNDDGLKRLQKNAKKLHGDNEISFEEMFNQTFMRKYTSFESFEKLLEAGNFTVESEYDFDSIPEDKLNDLIKSTTRFTSWNDMLSKAGEEWALKNLLK